MNRTGSGKSHDEHPAATTRRYDVEVTVRETFTMVVEAATAKEARRLVFDPDTPLLAEWQHGDRTMTGVKRARRSEDA